MSVWNHLPLNPSLLKRSPTMLMQNGVSNKTVGAIADGLLELL
jgi:hypothetical protein